MIEYALLAIAPGIFWMWFWWRKDRFEKEPARYLVITFFLGALVLIPAAILETVLQTGIWVVDEVMVGVIEEFSKFLAVYLFVFRKSEFNEVMDGIVYAAAAALGFASLENFLYIFGYGAGVMVGRAVFSTLGHVLFSAFWGYALGLKKIEGRNVVFTGLILAAGTHAIYNMLLESVCGIVLMIALILALYIITSRRVKYSLSVSPFRTGRPPKAAAVVRCPNCGTEIDTETVFCPNCGTKV